MTKEEVFKHEKEGFKAFLKTKTRAQCISLIGEIFDFVEKLDQEELEEVLTAHISFN